MIEDRLGPSGYGGYIYGSNPEGYALHGYRDDDEDDGVADYEIYGGSEKIGNVEGLSEAKAIAERHAAGVALTQIMKLIPILTATERRKVKAAL